MTPVRWRHVRQLFEQALELDADSWPEFLSQACAGDQALHLELSTLLEAHSRADELFENQSVHPAGTSIGHYRIQSIIGRGGMGVVYRAFDTRLERDIALKVLPLRNTKSATEQLRNEAKAVSAVNHPNIVIIYDAGCSNDVDFIAMELVEGTTLASLIRGSPLPAERAMACAIQVADALAAAHKAGIVHRDIKPANLMVTRSGIVKVLDFGLFHRQGKNFSQSTTESHGPPGTLSYMSPEQVQELPAHTSSDVFSFGAVFYEMLTGRKAFEGATRRETLDLILRAQPPRLTNPAHQRVLEHCLRKDPTSRYTAAGIAIELRRIKAGPNSRRRVLVGVAVTAVVASAMLLWTASRRQTGLPQRTLVRLTSESGMTTEPAISSDGKLLAYASDRSGEGTLDIWVQPMPEGQPWRVAHSSGDVHEPSFSPDGRSIVFRSEADGGAIFAIPVRGGTPHRLAERGRRPRYSPDGRWIAYWTGIQGSGDPVAPGASNVYVIPAAGGESRKMQAALASALYPVWSPDSKWILVIGPSSSSPWGHSWWSVPLDGSPPIESATPSALGTIGLPAPIPGEWTPDGRIICSNRRGNHSLWQVSISPATLKLNRPPEQLTFGAGGEDFPSSGPRGLIVFAGLAETSSLRILPIDTDRGLTRGPLTKLSGHPGEDIFINLTADGKRLAFLRSISANLQTGILTLDGGNESIWVIDPKLVWSQIDASGSNLFYLRARVFGEQSALYRMPAGGKAVELPCRDCLHPWDVSPDDTRLLLLSLEKPARIAMVDLRTGARTALLTHPAWNLYSARFSPDQRWVLFEAKIAPDRARLYIAPFREDRSLTPVDWIVVSDGQSYDGPAQWSPDGTRIYYYSDRDGFPCLWSQPLDPHTKERKGKSVAIYHFHQSTRGDNSTFTLSRERIVFALQERTANIWMMK